jgi:hypothetical protein
MVYPPQQTINVRSNGIGLTGANVVLPLVIGHTSAGTPDTLYQYTDPQKLKDEQGHGAGVEVALGQVLGGAGGCLLLVPTASTAGAAGSVTKTAAGSGTGTVTVAGEPYLPFRVKVRIRLGGVLGAAKFDFTLDDAGDDLLSTFSAVRTVPSGGTFAIPGTNLTLTFVPGAGTPTTYDTGDTHTFVCTAPQYTTSDLGTAVTALLDQIGVRKIRRVFGTHESASGSAGATMATAFATHLQTLEGKAYFARAMVGAGSDTAANVISGFASFADDRVAVCHGLGEMVALDAFEGWGVPRVPASWIVARREAATSLSENLGRRLSGNLSGFVRAIRGTAGAWGYDEELDGAFSEDDRIITLTSQRGRPGFWATNGFLKSAPGSDFKFWHWGKVVDIASEVIKDEQDKDLLRSVRTIVKGAINPLDPREADAINQRVRQALAAALSDPPNAEGEKGHVTAFSYAVDETVDFIGSGIYFSNFNAIPLRDIEGIVTNIGLARRLAA